MGYEYLDHTADVGLRASGPTLAEALRQGALGLFQLMVDLERVTLKQEVPIFCSAGDPTILFVTLLNELLTQRDLAEMLFAEFRISNLAQRDGIYHLEGVALGEPMDARRHQPKAEVKAATYGALAYHVEKDGRHVVQCILDL